MLAQRNSLFLPLRLHRSPCPNSRPLPLLFLSLLRRTSSSHRDLIPYSLLTSSWDTTVKESALILPGGISWRKQAAPKQEQFCCSARPPQNKSVGSSKKKKNQTTSRFHKYSVFIRSFQPVSVFIGLLI